MKVIIPKILYDTIEHHKVLVVFALIIAWLNAIISEQM